MQRRWFQGMMFGVFLLGIAAFYFVIPSLGAAAFLSPDETATAIAARQFGSTGTMRIEDALLKSYPWVHPRSWVTVDGGIAPVGFLGMPAFASVVWKLFGDWGMVLATPLLALSVLFPIWSFTKRFGRLAQCSALAVWLSFPTLLLYANRGLFPNVPELCLTVWSCYLIWRFRTIAPMVGAGLLAGLAISMRPIDLLWMAPWFVAAWVFRSESLQKKGVKAYVPELAFAFGAVFACGIVGLIAWKTYGAPFQVGYWLRDPIIQADATTSSMPTVAPVVVRWPFGFHPKNVWFNFQTYLLGFLWPWMLVLAAATFAWWKDRRGQVLIAIAAWTGFALCMLYGQGIYQDHVGVNVASSGNSFLRYVLPLSVVFVGAVAALVGWLEKRFPQMPWVVGWCAIPLVGVLVVLGLWSGLTRDKEGVFLASNDVIGYIDIRAQMQQSGIPRDVVVFSDRSDKVFFPSYRVVSPIPDLETVRSFLYASGQVGYLFDETLDEQAMASWHEHLVLPEKELSFGHQALYRLEPMIGADHDE